MNKHASLFHCLFFFFIARLVFAHVVKRQNFARGENNTFPLAVQHFSTAYYRTAVISFIIAFTWIFTFIIQSTDKTTQLVKQQTDGFDMGKASWRMTSSSSSSRTRVQEVLGGERERANESKRKPLRRHRAWERSWVISPKGRLVDRFLVLWWVIWQNFLFFKTAFVWTWHLSKLHFDLVTLCQNGHIRDW